jgi:hypothetical protein
MKLLRAVVPLAALLAALMVCLSACGGEAKPKADPGPSPSQTPTPTPSATPSPTAATQPQGQHGVTVKILNWDQYADEPAVLAAKQRFEDLQASVNIGKLVPGLLGKLTGQARAELPPALQQAQANHLRTRKLGYWRVRSVRNEGATSTVVFCAWRPSVDFYQANGKPYGTIAREWKRSTTVLRRSGAAWKLSKLDVDGTCPGGPPA